MQWLSEIFRRLRHGKTSDSAIIERGLFERLDNDAPGDESKTPRADGFESAPTIRIGSKTQAKLAWPARDQHRNSSQSNSAQETELRALSPDDEPTKLVDDQLIRSEKIDRARGRGFAASPDAKADAEGQDSMTHLVLPGEFTGIDPVAAWLVVIQGPGKGRSIEVKIGANSIGRAPSQQVCLDFGDQQISRERHAVIVYDPLSKRFFLQNGEVRNLTYLNGEVVLRHVELNGGETIILGNTHLCFVPLCGPNFSWS
jgi:hypothetical protein